MEFIARRTSEYSWRNPKYITNCPDAQNIQFGDEKYSIVEINSIDGLINFIDKYGRVVISKKKYEFEATKPEHEYIIEIIDY